jgi:hypothetical protein
VGKNDNFPKKRKVAFMFEPLDISFIPILSLLLVAYHFSKATDFYILKNAATNLTERLSLIQCQVSQS